MKKKKYWDPYIPKYKKTVKEKEDFSKLLESNRYEIWAGTVEPGTITATSTVTIEPVEYSRSITCSKDCILTEGEDYILITSDEPMKGIKWIACPEEETDREENDRLHQEKEDKHYW